MFAHVTSDQLGVPMRDDLERLVALLEVNHLNRILGLVSGGLASSRCFHEPRGRDRKLSESDSDGVEHGVGHGRGHPSRAELADPFGPQRAGVVVDLIDKRDVDFSWDVSVDGKCHTREVLGVPAAEHWLEHASLARGHAPPPDDPSDHLRACRSLIDDAPGAVHTSRAAQPDIAKRLIDADFHEDDAERPCGHVVGTSVGHRPAREVERSFGDDLATDPSDQLAQRHPAGSAVEASIDARHVIGRPSSELRKAVADFAGAIEHRRSHTNRRA